jgi:SSS family solute:Na+ symporter
MVGSPCRARHGHKSGRTTRRGIAIGGWSFPGYSALYTLVLNLVLALALTPVFNAISAARKGGTVAADYQA